MRTSRHCIWNILGMMGAVTLLGACGGDADFAGGSGQSQDAVGQTPDGPVEPPVETPTPLGTYAALTWHWQCENSPGEVPKPNSDDELVLEGTGPHSFPHERLLQTPVTFSGDLCPPEALPRDMVFVIDTSGSMLDPEAGNDPMVNGTCSRMQAVENVINAVPEGIGRFGIVTFSDTSELTATSSTLWGTKDELQADLEAGGSPMASLVCAAIGGTDYQDGLVRARALLESGDPQASKEIYFISDGQPENDGALEASQLRYPGVSVQGVTRPVTIATVMLGGNDTALEEKIASRVDDGQGNMVPLHAYVTMTEDLTDVLTGLSNNEIVDAKLKYRAIGSREWQQLSILDHLDGFHFQISAENLKLESAAEGVEVYYTYKDAHDSVYEVGGKLLWSDGTSE